MLTPGVDRASNSKARVPTNKPGTFPPRRPGRHIDICHSQVGFAVDPCRASFVIGHRPEHPPPSSPDEVLAGPTTEGLRHEPPHHGRSFGIRIFPRPQRPYPGNLYPPSPPAPRSA